MTFQKKNVIQGFMKDEYYPTSEQFLVKYLSGKGNNLHEVECFDGTTILVSMPKKYRQTVWLKKDDCLVLDPIKEGKKVKGEIFCVLSDIFVRELITTRQWSPQSNSENGSVDPEELLKFFDKNSNRKTEQEDYNPFPPSSDSSDLESEGDNEGQVDLESENEDENDGNSESI